ncbi:uncharacterized protein K441DRAFT_580049 [Cenococcum geophilum 1.58]|uniref:uncharacterized protein n=1 Tax=Cenococcum geophilum 1.58 TaxID=794803 RepID=UPI00358FCFE8|nr:hypothetical protein K441DRAFT_580049 [Cenococcum geophilum 1.58]
MVRTPPYPDTVVEASLPLCRPDPAALPQLEIPQPSAVTTNQRQNEAENCQSKMQGWWDQSISKNMGLPDGYQHVSVLLIKWHDEIDQLEVAQEVRDLEKLFKETFNYQTTVVELDAVKPQLRLECEITRFAFENDAKHNLLILYYAGHGIYNHKEDILYLAAYSGSELPRVSWNEAVRTLVNNVEGDIFALMDCCFASNPYARSILDFSRIFEIMAASGVDQVTPRPGKHSFTRALIESLEALAAQFKDSFFSTRDLHEKVIVKRPNTPPALWRGIPNNNRHVRLSPMKGGQQNQVAGPKKETPRGLLSLQFALRDDRLSQLQIDVLTRTLPKAFHNARAPVHNILWLDFKNARPPRATFKTAATMVTSLNRWKSLPGGSSQSSTSVKRKADQMTPDHSEDTPRNKKMVNGSLDSNSDG